MKRPERSNSGRTPTEIRLHRQSRRLEVAFDDGLRAELSAEYLRVYSPSAEVRGHGPGQAVLQVGKQDVAITGVEPVGQYAVKLVFDDGHDTGLYSWDLLYDLAAHQSQYWQEYQQALADAGYQRSSNGQGKP